MAKGGYPKMKPCSDVDDKMPSKCIGCVPKNNAVTTLSCSLNTKCSKSSAKWYAFFETILFWDNVIWWTRDFDNYDQNHAFSLTRDFDLH